MKYIKGICVFVILCLCLTAFLSCDDTSQTPLQTSGAESTAITTVHNEENKDTPEEEELSHTHVYGTWELTEEPTCVKGGKESSECTVCGAVAQRDIVATGIHDISEEWETVELATPISNGRRIRGCKNCDYIHESEIIPASDENIEVNISQNLTSADIEIYSVIYAAKSSGFGLFKSTVDSFASSIGSEIQVNVDSKVLASDSNYEILIGETDRGESDRALAELDGNGFIIRCDGKKISVVGSNDLYTIYGMNYFVNVYLSGESRALMVPESITAKVDEIKFMDMYSCDYIFVTDADTNNTPAYYANKLSEDLIFNCSNGIGIDIQNFKQQKDSDLSRYELLIGNTDREEYRAFIEQLDGNEYGIFVGEEKIILAAWNEAALEECVSQFQKILSKSKTVVGASRVWMLPVGFYAKGVGNEKWVTDFPRPEGDNIELYNTQDANDGALQYYYVGEGVSIDSFEAYVRSLIESGYSVLSESYVEGSAFKTLINDNSGISLHIIYSDYKYKQDYIIRDDRYVDYKKSIRIIAAPLSSAMLPDEDMFEEEQSYTKIADSTLTIIGLEGMSYVVRLEDGRFIVVDGGYNPNSEEIDLWETLVALHTEAYGTAPSEENPVCVAAWIITHSHPDHFYTFRGLLKRYGKTEPLKIESMIGNFPAVNILYPTEVDLSDKTINIATMGREKYLSELQGFIDGGFKYIKVHTGQKLYIANVAIEILATYEDQNPQCIKVENDTSTVFRMFISNSDAPDMDPTSILFLGDAERYESRYLCAMYGSYLEADMVQVAHHGWNGCEWQLYETVQPTVVLFPQRREHLINMLNPSIKDDNWYFYANYYVTHEIEKVKYILGSEESYRTTLIFTPNGPDYDNLYDAKSGEKIQYDGQMLIKR